MELPDGWRVGHAKNVSPQWAEQWSEYVGKAENWDDLTNLRFVLDDRKGWLFPQTVRRFSQLLVDRAQELDMRIAPVVSPMKEKSWHADLTDFQAPKSELSETSKRMMGEAQ